MVTRVFIFLLFYLLISSFSIAQIQISPLTTPDLEEDSRFGHSIQLSEAFACISAPYQIIAGNTQQGAVYMFDKATGWAHSTTLLAPDGSQFDRFGYSMAMQGSLLAVGAPGKSSGVVYLYAYQDDTWVYQQTIKPDVPSGHYMNAMQFGFKVAMVDEYLFVSAPRYLNGPTVKESSVYVYQHGDQGWTFLQRLVHPDGQPGTLFGYSLAANGQRLIIGASKSNGGSPSSGSAFLYEPDGGEWLMKHRFVYPQSLTHERFGTSVDIHGDRVIIGSMMHVFDEATGPKGAAHVFEYTGGTWLHSGMLSNDLTSRNDFFAQHVAINGNIAVASSTRTNYVGKTNAGVVHVFRLENGFWTLKYHLSPDTNRIQSHMYFGGALALSGQHLAIGSHLEDNTQEDSGNSYLHDLESLVSDFTPSVQAYALYPPMPNPFNHETAIRFDLPEQTELRLIVYDPFGQPIDVIAQGTFPAGIGQFITWNPRHLPAGSYFIQMKAGNQIAIVKAIHIR